MTNIEVEFRAIISKEKYKWLNKYLLAKAKDLGQDNKNTTFYIMPNKLFKVVNETSKNQAKIVLKDGHISNGSSLKEWEIIISPKDYNKAVELFNHLDLPGKLMSAYQKRHNYIYKGVEIAVKFSEQWQYHVEMEMVINNASKQIEAESKIKNLSDELGIKLMTDKEIKAFTYKIESKL